jgi:hypothetical protein
VSYTTLKIFIDIKLILLFNNRCLRSGENYNETSVWEVHVPCKETEVLDNHRHRCLITTQFTITLKKLYAHQTVRNISRASYLD